ncbi:MAG: pilus assembly PilX family protein [Desulfobacteria bacterium]
MKPVSVLKDNRGAALVVSILIMAVLMLIGAAAIITSSIEIKISGNEKNSREAFYAAEAAWPTALIWLDNQSAPFMGNEDDDTDDPRIVSNVAVGANQFSYELNYQGPPRDIPGYSTDYKDFYYDVECTGNGPGVSESSVQITASKAHRVVY